MSKVSVQTNFKLWPSLKHWLANVNLQQDPEKHTQVVDLWYDAFILSDDADDQEVRGEVMMMRDNLKNLFHILGQVSPKKRNEKLNKILGA